MGHDDSADCPDIRTIHRTSPARRAGVITATMSLALLTAAVATIPVPDSGPAASLALSESQGSTTQPATFTADEIAITDREAAARIAGSSRSADRGAVPSSASTPEPATADLAAAKTKAAPKPKPKIVGSRYAEVRLKVRKTPTENADVVAVLGTATKIKITDITEDGFRQIVYKDKPRWVTAEFLSKSKPKPKPKPTASGSASGGLSSAACASGSGVEGGLGANAIAAHRAICARFPGVTSFGGYRPGSGNHASGRALDVMISGAAGQEIAYWAQANASALGITEVIYAQRIWTTQRAGDGWRGMSDRGSATANHYDHVHLSFR
jgi:hypothetical protein